MVFIAQGMAAAQQQPLVETSFTQHLLVPVTVHQKLEDVGHSQLQVKSVLEGTRERKQHLVLLHLQLAKQKQRSVIHCHIKVSSNGKTDK